MQVLLQTDMVIGPVDITIYGPAVIAKNRDIETTAPSVADSFQY
tara:strand:- start:228559 stop:228690 length:132 start_codon:yes stop_codon:yes gene_type:complete